ncbi:stAR-related lipid transfer protein 13-like isoform X3 [Anguilla anguilla]|uniref:stAR-related lipid transfer protein 13-like isoform X3 n=1 Tax=Anguilla anguilla TaxID=7936 RepID=UPI0015B060F7|nr:stAR-related lipid transfer protein 13-like isoform X3 [Anguilla anguilla]
MRTQNKSDSLLREREHEAKEACDWLRAAGFPQYAHLYEDGLLPIDISSVKKDHDFLDQDSLKSLCRRLTALNKCASMKLEVHFQRKESEDSEEDDLCAISDRWAFQRDSKRWSRLGALSYPSPSPSPGVEHAQTSEGEWGSRESVLSDLSDLGAASSHSNSSLGMQSARITSSSSTVASSSHSDPPPAEAPPPGRARPKRRTRSFLRRIESFRRKERESGSERAAADAQDTPPATGADTPPPASLACTAGDRLPGGGGRSRSPFARRALTLGRASTANGPNGTGRWGRAQSGGFCLEDFQVPPSSSDSPEQRGRDRRAKVVHLPPDHKPGTFPRSLSVESLCPPSPGEELEGAWRVGGASLDDACVGGAESADSPGLTGWRRGSCDSEGSVYDNIPEPPLGGAPQDISQHLDDILQHVQGIQHSLHMWSRKICPEMEDEEEGEDEEEEGSLISGGTVETVCTPSLRFEEHSISDVGTAASDVDSTGNSLNEGEEHEDMRERRDSGVGASLTRPNRKLRWHSFQNSHRPSLTSASLEINRQAAAQLNLLQKFSLLRLTATMERYSVPSKQGWSWTVPKFMKRSKAPDYRDKNVFGVPPLVNVQRSGQPLPQSIQQAMRYLRSRCRDQVGIFRKSGVKSRIQALRRLNEASPDHVDYEGQSAYDVADMLKQYFRDLPEPVFTAKLTETFLQIYQWVPKEQQLQAAQAAVILLPDESREVLQTLLYFLSDIASALGNQMTAGNLAVCLAPSIFHLNVSKKEGSSPRLIHGRNTTNKPDHRDLNENMAATHGLGHMIVECKKLFQIPPDMMLQSRNSYLAADTHPLPLHGLGINLKGEPVDYRAFLEDSIQCLLREMAEKSRGWHSATAPSNTELAYKKVGDRPPIRLWRSSTEIEAAPTAVLHRVLRERHLWDDDLLHSRVIEALESNTEVFHYVTDSMAPHPRRDFVVLRRWRSDLPRGACLLVSSSVDHDAARLEAGLQALLLTSRWLIEPVGPGRSRLTHYCRADLRGRSPEWYNKVFGHLCAVEVARIRDSFPVFVQGQEARL